MSSSKDRSEQRRRYREEKRADPEWQAQQRERDRRYRAENREAINARRRASRDNPARRERDREINRASRARNREAINQRRRDQGYDQAYRAEKASDPEYQQREQDRGRRYRRENREAISRRRNAVTAPLRAVWTHGPNATQVLAVMWEQQEGFCYLCAEPLERKDAAVDHDHTCCPKGKTCAICRRGFACRRCNLLVGMVDDDPMLLRRIAGNLGLAIDLYRERAVAKPIQLNMLDAVRTATPAPPVDPEHATA